VVELLTVVDRVRIHLQQGESPYRWHPRSEVRILTVRGTELKHGFHYNITTILRLRQFLESEAAAREAIDQLFGTRMGGRELTIRPFRSKSFTLK